MCLSTAEHQVLFNKFFPIACNGYTQCDFRAGGASKYGLSITDPSTHSWISNVWATLTCTRGRKGEDYYDVKCQSSFHMIKCIYMFYSNQQKLFPGNRKKWVGLHTRYVAVQHTNALLLWTWEFLKTGETQDLDRELAVLQKKTYWKSSLSFSSWRRGQGIQHRDG